MDSAVGHHRNLVLNALSDWQPVQRVTKYRSDVLDNKTLRRDFLGVSRQKNLGLKTYPFSTTSQLNGNFEAQETTKGPLHRPKISRVLVH